MLKKLITKKVSFFILFYLLLGWWCQYNVVALSNGLAFVEKGQKPLAVTVSYYSDIYSRGFAWTTMEKTSDSSVQIIEEGMMLDWSKSKIYSGSYITADQYYCHKAVAYDLLDGKTYKYRVGSISDNVFSEVGTIKVDNGKNGFSFIFATDPQDYDYKGFCAWADLVSAAYQTLPDASFFACGGDLVNDSHSALSHDYDQWIYAMELPKQYFMNSVFVPTAGNHECYDTSFTDRFAINYQGSKKSGGYYSFNVGSMHLTVLNTNESDNMTSQIRWLEKDLESAQAMPWKALLLHKGLLSTGDHYNDGDVKDLRQFIVPLMAKYQVDMVMQGHDHVYVRTVPYFYGKKEDGNYYLGETPNNEETLITEVEGDETTTYSVDPSGTFYVTANYSGRKSYATVEYDQSIIYPAINPYNSELMSKQIKAQTFCTIEIRDNNLKFNTYLYDDGKISLYDTYNIMKNTYVPVEQSIINLPSLDRSTILDFLKIKETYMDYSHLTKYAKQKLSLKSVAKIEELITKFPLDDCEAAYDVASLISQVGESNISSEYRNQLKEIKAKYNDLSDKQKDYIFNYSKINEIEENISTLYIIKAFNEMIEQYKNGEITRAEITSAYNVLNEEQKGLVDISDIEFIEDKPLLGCQNRSIISFIPLTIFFIFIILFNKIIKMKYKKENL